MPLRGNRVLVTVVVMMAQMAVMTFFGAMSIIIPLISDEVHAPRWLAALPPGAAAWRCRAAAAAVKFHVPLPLPLPRWRRPRRCRL